jgi:hypothetical protein
MEDAIVIGVVTRTGSAVLVALSGTADMLWFRARREIGLVPPGLPAQPYHVAAGMDLAAARQMIGQVEHGAQKAAAAGLRSIADTLPAGAICGVAVVVKAMSVPDRLPEILRSHAWMHAAEGLLSRQAVLAAAQDCGWTAHTAELPLLPAAGPALTTLGQAAGRPWRRIEKDAARAAITILTGTRGPDYW